MNRTLVSGIAVFALMIGASLSATTAHAGHGGGLFSRLGGKKCCSGGGLFSRLHSRSSSDCCAPAPPSCCEPAPAPASCCQSAPAPAPCCEPAPAPASCCQSAPASAPCCESAPAPCCGGDAGMAVEAAPMEVGSGCEGCGNQGYNLAPGETLVPGSVHTVGSGDAAAAPAVGAPAAAAPAAAGDLPPAPTPAPAAESASPSDAGTPPPAPTPDANTNI